MRIRIAIGLLGGKESVFWGSLKIVPHREVAILRVLSQPHRETRGV